MLIIYSAFFIILIVLICNVIKNNTQKNTIKFYLVGLFIILFTALSYSLNDCKATNNIYILNMSIDFFMLIIFFALTLMSIPIINMIYLIIDLKKEKYSKQILALGLLVAVIILGIRYLLSKIQFNQKFINILGVVIIVIIFCAKIHIVISEKKKKIRNKRKFKMIDKLKNSIVKDVECVHCGSKIKNTKFQCDYCKNNQIENVKVIAFNKDEILLLCKMLRKKNISIFEQNMKQLLKNIKEHGMKIIVIGTGISGYSIKKIEKSSINQYIDAKFFSRRKLTIKRDKKMLEKVINDMQIKKNEMLFIGNFNDGKMFIAREMGIYSIRYICTDMLNTNLFDMVKLDLYNIFNEERETKEIEALIFKDL